MTKHWTFQETLCSAFLQKSCVFMPTKLNLLENWSLLSTYNEDCLLNTLWNKKSEYWLFNSSEMRLVFILFVFLIDKIVTIELRNNSIFEWVIFWSCNSLFWSHRSYNSTPFNFFLWGFFFVFFCVSYYLPDMLFQKKKTI